VSLKFEKEAKHITLPPSLLEMFCNSYRRHSSLGYKNPNDFEKGIINKKVA
jgi:hypothetical protein